VGRGRWGQACCGTRQQAAGGRRQAARGPTPGRLGTHPAPAPAPPPPPAPARYIIDLGHPVICLEYKHVSLRLTARIPTIDDVTHDVVAILDKFDIGRCAAGGRGGGWRAARGAPLA
jgi:hypothetical protein